MVKVNLVYPKIPDSRNSPTKTCIAFKKYDGTNLHWVWERELSWYGFGTRRDRFDLDAQGIKDFNQAHPGLEQSSEIFLENFAKPLETIFLENPKYQTSPEIIVFTEFFGPNSFAGMHKKEDAKELVMFDVQTDKEIISPDEFIIDFAELNIAEVVYKGKLTGKFKDDVREGKYDVVEGVICKGGKGDDLWMVKVKTYEYLEKLKQAFADDWENYWE
ncbi:MAG: RNA ligase family protein [Blastocatellia bacterium]